MPGTATRVNPHCPSFSPRLSLRERAADANGEGADVTICQISSCTWQRSATKFRLNTVVLHAHGASQAVNSPRRLTGEGKIDLTFLKAQGKIETTIQGVPVYGPENVSRKSLASSDYKCRLPHRTPVPPVLLRSYAPGSQERHIVSVLPRASFVPVLAI